MIIDDIATYIDTEVTGLTLATNLFKGFMPESPANIVVLYDTGGAEPDRDIPTGLPTFQVLVRNTSYKQAHDIAHEIADLLHQKANVTIGDNYYYYIFLMGEPGHIGRDEKGRDEYSVNFIAKVKR